jgi:hypothetical protein
MTEMPERHCDTSASAAVREVQPPQESAGLPPDEMDAIRRAINEAMAAPVFNCGLYP